MKVLVIGKEGQVARSLVELDGRDGVAIVAVGRPQIDLTKPDTVAHAIDAASAHVIVNAAAYTAVDNAETELELANLINAEGAGLVAEVCAERSLPLIHLSTDYVFDGTKSSPYNEGDPVAPLGVYGRSKLEGERRVSYASPRHVILRTAWVVSPFGHNFVKTMLRLADGRKEIDIVHDQRGNPTYAPHLAQAILAIAGRLDEGGDGGRYYGTYHAVGTGEASWCELAREVFRCSSGLGGPSAKVGAITTADYPTPAARPANSRLDCAKLEKNYGLKLPDWRAGVAACVRNLVASSGATPAK